jgi:hypothetical protein
MRKLAHAARLALLTLLLLVAAPLAEAQEAQPVLEATTPTVRAGERAYFVGRGFVRNERLSAWVTTSDQRVLDIGFAKAYGDEGRVELSYRVRGDAISGRWALTLYGEVSQTPVVAFFEVIGRSPANSKPPIAVEPPAGPPGTRFKFFASGYDEDEDVSHWFTAPDGTLIAFPEANEASKDGEVYFEWMAPATAQAGVWVVTVQGKRSNVARGISFEIR